MKGATMRQKLREMARMQPPGIRFVKGNYASDAVVPEMKEPVRNPFVDLKKREKT